MIDPIFERINRLMREILEQFENEFGNLPSSQGVSGFRLYWDSSMPESVIEKFGGGMIGGDMLDLADRTGTAGSEDVAEPLVDVFEDKDNVSVEVYVHLPGVTSLDEVAITPVENVIKIEAETPSKRYKKTIELKDSVDSDYEAELNNGVLSLVFKKKD